MQWVAVSGAGVARHAVTRQLSKRHFDVRVLGRRGQLGERCAVSLACHIPARVGFSRNIVSGMFCCYRLTPGTPGGNQN